MNVEKDLTRKQWNEGAESWNDFVENGKDFGKTIIAPGIMKLLPQKRRAKEKALDLCCGEGYYSRLLKEKGYEVSGVDISEKLIEMAQRKDKDIAYYCTDAAQMEVLGTTISTLLCAPWV